MGTYAAAARRRVHLATVLLWPPSGHRQGRRQARHARIPEMGLNLTQPRVSVGTISNRVFAGNDFPYFNSCRITRSTSRNRQQHIRPSAVDIDRAATFTYKVFRKHQRLFFSTCIFSVYIDLVKEMLLLQMIVESVFF